MTWRKLTDAEKAKITDEKSAIALMREKTSIIKRPLLELENGGMILGFDESTYRESLKKAA